MGSSHQAPFSFPETQEAVRCPLWYAPSLAILCTSGHIISSRPTGISYRGDHYSRSGTTGAENLHSGQTKETARGVQNSSHKSTTSSVGAILDWANWKKRIWHEIQEWYIHISSKYRLTWSCSNHVVCRGLLEKEVALNRRRPWPRWGRKWLGMGEITLS